MTAENNPDRQSGSVPAVAGAYLFEASTKRLIAASPNVEAGIHFATADPDAQNEHALWERIYGTDAAAEVERVFTGKRSSVQIACEIRGSRDSRPFKLDVRRLVGADRKLVVVLASFADEHPYLGDCDPLTGLPNRQAARRQAEAWQAPSAGPSTPFAVLFVDLDEFKRINDQFGHSQGDEVLRVLAERWQHCVRDDDLVVRYGGDEFLMLISGVTTPTEAQPIVSRVCAETSRPIVTKAAEFRVTASVGVAFSQQPSESFDAVVDEADRQMYARRRSACHPPRPPR